MERPIRRGTWLLGFVVVGWTAVALLRNHSESVQHEQERTQSRDDLLDSNFNDRAPVPLEARVMLSTEQGNYQVPADQPSFRQHIASLGKLPAIIVLPGCGFPIWGKDVPLNVAILSVDENPNLLESKTTVEACKSRLRPAAQHAFKQQLVFLANYVERKAWIDTSRVMIAGYGEAAPVVAAYSGPASQRLTLGDPCFVPWENISGKTPILMLFTSRRQGLMRDDAPEKPIDIAEIAKGAGPPLPRVKPCLGLARPKIRPPARQIVASGRLGMFERPEVLSNAQKAAYNGL